MITTRCSSCGQLNRADAEYCVNCGTPLGAAAYVALLQGQRLHNGEYTIVGPLGRGGMGVVYLATQSMAGATRQVVVKEMLDYFNPTDLQQAQNASERFQKEAATLLTLNHAHIPQVFDYFTEGGRNYIVMQYIDGESLDQRLTRSDDSGNTIKGLPPSHGEIARWGIRLCQVLEYLANRVDSASGAPLPVIHHDIKPANLIIGRHVDGVWLVDFGTARARLVSQAGGRVGMVRSSIYGTAGYAPPEQYEGKSEARSDVYALAATLYHLATDDDPRAHPFQFPLLARLPSGLRAAMQPALAAEASERSTATEFRQALERYTRDVSKPPGGGKSLMAVLSLILVLAFAALAFLGADAVLGPGQALPPASPPLAPVVAATPSPAPTATPAIVIVVATPTATTASELNPLVAPPATALLPTATPLPTEAMSTAITGTAASATPALEALPDPTTPAPTATSPPPATPTPVQALAPELLSPADGQSFDGPIEDIVLTWQSVDLPDGACYVVTIKYEHGSAIWDDVHCLLTTSFNLPDYLADVSTGSQFAWKVTIMKPKGSEFKREQDGEPLGPASAVHTFEWRGSRGSDGGSGSGPQPTPTRP